MGFRFRGGTVDSLNQESFESEAEIKFQDEIHGSLISQVDRVIDLLYTKYLKGIISYDGITRVETYPYPKNAIREAVLNAIAHKNYAAMIPIQIKVFDDHLVIANDCVFPENWTVDTLLGPHRSHPYNPLIAYALYRAGFIESWGRGIQKIKDSCEESGNSFPKYTILADEISVEFRALNSNVGQDVGQDVPQERKEIIIKKIMDNPNITQEEIAKCLNLSLKTIKREMKKIDNVRFVGSGYSGHWEIIKL